MNKNTWIALLRGINVGGNHILPMAELRKGLTELGLKRVRTYIQSGNVVFESESANKKKLQSMIEDWIKAHYRFRPQLFLLKGEDLMASVAANPYPQAAEKPKTLHFFFLEEPAIEADMESIEKIRAANEAVHLTDKVFYLHAPGGIGISKLAANVERHLRVRMTARNFRTVTKLASMALE